MIKLQVIGNLGRDCTENDVNGNHVINFVVAHSTKYKEVEKTIWVDCSYWTDKTGIVPFLRKGTTVFVEGTPDVRTYQTNDGRQAASLTLRVQTIQLLGGNRSEDTGSNTAASNTGTVDYASTVSHEAENKNTEDEDDLPF